MDRWNTQVTRAEGTASDNQQKRETLCIILTLCNWR